MAQELSDFEDSKSIQSKLNKPRELKIDGRVGFDSLPDQLVTKATQRGFNFNVLCIGETGIGKSTLMSTLCLGVVFRV